MVTLYYLLFLIIAQLRLHNILSVAYYLPSYHHLNSNQCVAMCPDPSTSTILALVPWSANPTAPYQSTPKLVLAELGPTWPTSAA
jgi:hypothetical protein